MNLEISKIVLDTNILVSGYLFGGVPRKIIELGVCGDAEYIVSGDRHLLELKQYSSIEIVTARDYLEFYKKLNK